MSDTVSPPPSPPTQPPPPPIYSGADERQLALIIYILYLIPFAWPVAHIVGLVLAYVNRPTTPAWLNSHYTYQIRTFW
ncbi:MAG: hypothetical protein ACRED8_14190, partial [Caulobacteraceae bacterium]